MIKAKLTSSQIGMAMLYLTTLISSLVLCGWMSGSEIFIRPAPHLPPMVFNTALFFLLIGLNLYLKNFKVFEWPLRIVNLFIIVISALTICQFFFFAEFGIDEMFFKDHLLSGVTHPGRMGPNTALGFIFISVSNLLDIKDRSHFSLKKLVPFVLYTFTILMGIISLIGFILPTHKGYVWASFNRMALQTALCFILLGTASLIQYYRSLVFIKLVDRKNKRKSLFVILVVLVLTVCFWYLFCRMDAHKIREIVRAELGRVETTSIISLNEASKNLMYLEKRLQNKEMNSAVWAYETQYLEAMPGLESLSWVDSKGVLNTESAHQKIDAEELTRLMTRAEILRAAERASDRREILFSQAVDLGTMKGFFIFVPSYFKNQFRGMIIGFIDGKKFFGSIYSTLGLMLHIKSNNITLFSNIKKNTPYIQQWASNDDINHKNLDLSFTIIPSHQIIASQGGLVPMIVLIIGSFLSIIMSCLLAVIHELRAARNQFAYSNQWLRAILNGSDLAVISTDVQGVIVSFNPAAEKLFGYSEKEIIGKKNADFWFDREQLQQKALELSNELERIVKPDFEALTAKSQVGAVDKQRWRVYSKNQDSYIIILSIHTIHAVNGALEGYVGIIENITERENQNLLIEEQRAKMVASAKMSSLGEMAASIAHEINNPLTVIKGMARIIKISHDSEKLEKEAITHSVDTIDNTVNRIAKIIGSLKTFARDSSNERPVVIKLSHIIDETIPFCAERFKNEKVDLRIDIDDDLHLFCRPVQISQVILNLLNNAYDAISQSEEKWVELSAKMKSDVIYITVTDSGTGIPHDIQKKMMMPFYTTKDFGKGTGLGLSISLGIVKGHKGEFYYDKNAKNTKFVITLPVSHSSAMVE